MTKRRVALVGMAATCAVVLVVLLEVVLPRVRQRKSDARELLLPATVRMDDLEELVILRDDDVITLKPATGAGWHVTSRSVPKDLVADRRAVELLHRALAGKRIIHEVAEDASDVSDLSQFGLSPPRFTLSWRAPGAPTRTLALGNPTPDGSGTHAILDGRRLVVVPAAVIEAAGWDLGHFRRKDLLRLTWDDLARLEILRNREAEGSASMVFEPDSHPAGHPALWRLVAPVTGAANTERIASVVSKLGTLVSAGFGAEEPTGDDLAKAGLAPPAAVVTAIAKDGTRHVVAIGDAGLRSETSWARVDDGPLSMIRGDLRADVMLHESFYREARAFPLPRWGLVNLRLNRGRRSEVVLELQNDPTRAWHAVLPADADLPADRVRKFLDRLDDVAVGRFEDDVAAAEKVLDFTGLASFLLQGTAQLEDGRAYTLTVEVGSPFIVGRGRYIPLRTTDNAGRVAITIATIDAFDKALDTASELVTLARSAAELRDGVAPTGSPPSP